MWKLSLNKIPIPGNNIHNKQCYYSLAVLVGDWSRLNAFTDDKLDVPQKVKFVLGRKEKIVGDQHFLLFTKGFPKFFTEVC